MVTAESGFDSGSCSSTTAHSVSWGKTSLATHRGHERARPGWVDW